MECLQSETQKCRLFFTILKKKWTISIKTHLWQFSVVFDEKNGTRRIKFGHAPSVHRKKISKSTLLGEILKISVIKTWFPKLLTFF